MTARTRLAVTPRMRTRWWLALALVLGITSVSPAAEARCTSEQQHAAEMVRRKVDAVNAKNDAEKAFNKAQGALDAALKKAKTYDADVAKAKSDVARYTRDSDECHKRRKDNACTWQDSNKRSAEERLAKLEANPPSKSIPEAEAELERAREACRLAGASAFALREAR